ncbi:BZ3500_MvSof-1268-A1-R1_Chr1-3g01857 [Microbotryum saponariae]|uniref:BZ3500_MvSof-1268-A1-R1_Chr1-3g01857 protein n=1 Tax=Microbotryum saponariae TaxID=289078 RepID=A0A2X0L3P6_9BASI|nr:BZ3500_MvSof-1268-A1-R1_Chr1-3g01857 [Microbotryum saponariae]SCZ94746.1 BZ3501_MvSof-1269-A2-R1_Chr1-3g01459 [Microbotryum saponariae]
MVYQPEIVPSSQQGQALQARTAPAAIQKQLAFLGWSTEDDTVMAQVAPQLTYEYCLVMLGNRKTAAQISTELSDLIGSDFDESFVSWLFAELKSHYPDPASNPEAATPAASAAPPTPGAAIPPSSANPSAGSDSSRPAVGIRGHASIPARPGAVFGHAVSGIKRDSRDMDGGVPSGPRDVQRPRFDHTGVPSGPRNPNGPGAGGRGGRMNGAGNGAGSLMNRMGPSQARNNPMPPQNAMGMPPQAFEAIAQTIEAVKRGAHPSALAAIPYPALASHPLAATLPPQIMAQAQAHAIAQAQAFAAMSNAWNVAPNAGPAATGGFNPAAAPFHPGAAGFGAPPPAQQQHRPRHPAQPPVPKQIAVVLPSKPSEEAICKHGVDCSKPQCPYSHPSPVATKESGLVLSSEACEKQVACADPDCPKSHVSPAQKTSPPTNTSTNFAGQTTFIPTPAPQVAPVLPSSEASSTLAGAGEKPCKFAGSCTRPGCVFVHPWDNPSTGGSMPCRYGLGCTRADCHFSHPPGRRIGGGGAAGAGAKRNVSATFSNKTLGKPSATTKKEGGIGAWPTEDKEHISERLKRFAGGEAQSNGTTTTTNGEGVKSEEEGKTETIIPGQTSQEQQDQVEIKGLEAEPQQAKVE